MDSHEQRTANCARIIISLALFLCIPVAAHAALPEAPTNLTATAVSPTNIRLDWTDNSSDESYFGIERKDAGGVFWLWTYASANATTKDMGGLDPGTTYTYRVAAINANGQSYSNEASATTVAIPAPVITGVTALSTSEIEIRWTDSRTDAMQYEIEITGGPYGTEMRQADQSATSLVVSFLYPNTEYTFKIRSADTSWTYSPYSNEARATTQSDTVPPVLQAAALSSKRVKLTWADVTNNETAYYVENRKESDGGFVVLDTLPANTITYTHTNLDPDISYIYRVRSYNGTYYGPYSNEVAVTTPGCVQEGPYIK